MQIWTFSKHHTFKYDFWEKTQYSNMKFWCFLVTPGFNIMMVIEDDLAAIMTKGYLFGWGQKLTFFSSYSSGFKQRLQFCGIIENWFKLIFFYHRCPSWEPLEESSSLEMGLFKPLDQLMLSSPALVLSSLCRYIYTLFLLKQPWQLSQKKLWLEWCRWQAASMSGNQRIWSRRRTASGPQTSKLDLALTCTSAFRFFLVFFFLIFPLDIWCMLHFGAPLQY